jgi:hypothetical protein
MPSTPALSVRGDSPRPLSKSQTLDFYRRELLASQYREAVLQRRIAQANTWLQSLGVAINPNPWDAVALTMDGLPVAPGV